MIESQHNTELAEIARYILAGEAPSTMLALSISADERDCWLRIRAHFDHPPTQEDIEVVQIAGTEIIAQWTLDDWRIAEDWEVLGPGQEPNALPGGIAWRRGDPEPPLVPPRVG